MVNGIRTGNPCGFNKGRSSKFREGSRVQQTPEEGWRTYQPKRCGNNNKDEDNSPKTLNDKNHRASSQKFRQLILQSTLRGNSYIFQLSNSILKTYSSSLFVRKFNENILRGFTRILFSNKCIGMSCIKKPFLS